MPHEELETVDVTPTWSAVMQIHIAAIIRNGSGAGAAIAEINRLAQSMDNIIAKDKADKEKGIISLGFDPLEIKVIKIGLEAQGMYDLVYKYSGDKGIETLNNMINQLNEI